MTTITISPTTDTDSTTVTTAGARDYDLTITVGDVSISASATLIPSEYDGRLGSWGQMDMWLSAGACAYARRLTDRNCANLCAAIVRACVNGEDTEIDLEINIEAGDRVEAGEGAEADAGIVQTVHGTQAWVGWDSGVRTLVDLADLRPEAS